MIIKVEAETGATPKYFSYEGTVKGNIGFTTSKEDIISNQKTFDLNLDFEADNIMIARFFDCVITTVNGFDNVPMTQYIINKQSEIKDIELLELKNLLKDSFDILNADTVGDLIKAAENHNSKNKRN